MPLPTYQPIGLLSQPTQRIDFAGMRESERNSQLLGQSLDRLSEFAFKAAAKQAIREGEQWAYNNPISDDQIARAKKGSLDIAMEMPEAGTYFGDAARKIQGAQLRSTLELTARRDIAKIYEKVEAGEITDISQLDKEFFALQKGNAKVIAKIDPEQANAFQASIATAAHPVYQAGAKKIGELRARYIEELVTNSLVDFDPLLRSIFDEETDPKKIKDQINIHRDRLLGQAVQANNVVTFDHVQKAIDLKIENAYIDRLTNYFSSKEFGYAAEEDSLVGRFNSVLNGNAGKFQAVWDKMPSELQKKVTDTFYTRESQKQKILQDNNAVREKENKTAALRARNDYYDGTMSADDLIDLLINTNQGTPAEIKAIRKGEDTTLTNDKLIFNLTYRIALNQVGEKEIRKYAEENQLTWKEATRLITSIDNQSKDLSQGILYINRGLGIHDPNQIGMDGEKIKAARLQNILVSEYNAARRSGSPFDIMGRAQALVSTGESANKQKIIDMAKESLDLGYTSAKVKPRDDGGMYTKDELQRHPNKLKDDQIKKILRLQDSVIEAER